MVLNFWESLYFDIDNDIIWPSYKSLDGIMQAVQHTFAKKVGQNYGLNFFLKWDKSRITGGKSRTKEGLKHFHNGVTALSLAV